MWDYLFFWQIYSETTSVIGWWQSVGPTQLSKKKRWNRVGLEFILTTRYKVSSTFYELLVSNCGSIFDLKLITIENIYIFFAIYVTLHRLISRNSCVAQYTQTPVFSKYNKHNNMMVWNGKLFSLKKKSRMPGVLSFNFGPSGSNIRLRPTWVPLLYFLTPSFPNHSPSH